MTEGIEMSETFKATSILLGLLLLAAAVSFVCARILLAKSTSANAVVVGLRAYQEVRTVRHLQIVEYQNSGETIQAELRAGIPCDVGTKLVVYYSANDPTHVKIKSQVYRPMIVFLILAALVFVGWFRQAIKLI
jgi:hypothetical protein